MTENKLQPIEKNSIDLYESDEALPLDQPPAAVYLMGLSAGNRRTMGGALDNSVYYRLKDWLVIRRDEPSPLFFGGGKQPHTARPADISGNL
jgi:hypothetical protein